VAGHAVDDVARLRAVRLQELAPRGHGLEEVLHVDTGANGPAAFLLVDDAPRVDADLRAGLSGGLAGLKCEARHAGYRRKGLSPEAEAREAVEVRGLGYLARCMPRERRSPVLRAHAVTVVIDADERPARVRKLDHDARGARVQGVLD